MDIRKNFKREVLDNGMTLLFEKRDVPVVSIGIAVRSGGANENSDEKGISHFIEHLLYKGTPTRSAFIIAEEIEKKGGELNGFTEEDLTAYWCKLPSEYAETGLNVLIDMVRNPLFSPDEIEKERKVIFEEIKMRHDNPMQYVFDKIQSFLYESPFGEDLIGNEKTMGSINKEKILEKFKRTYTPNNLIICVVGNYNFAKLRNIIKETFEFRDGSVSKIEIKKRNESKTEKRKGIDQANVVFAFHSPLLGENCAYASEVLRGIMTGGMSSRLFTEIREKRNLAYSILGDSKLRKDYAYSLIYVGTTKDNVEKIKELIIAELKKVSEELSEKELESVKEQLTGNYEISTEDSQVQMTNLLFSECSGSAADFYDYREKILDVELEDVKSLAAEAAIKYSFFALVPED
jgi:predicted Zn-dependent peptidase